MSKQNTTPKPKSHFSVSGRDMFAVCILTLALVFSVASHVLSAENDKDYEKALDAYNEKDYETALRRFIKSADNGNVNAMFRIGVIYLKGEGVDEDIVEAGKWFLKAAELGEPTSQYNVGAMYLDGIKGGVEKNEEEAAKWFLKSAENGFHLAQMKVGEIYYDGLCGIKKDITEAVKWFQKAADNGNADAKVKLGLMYKNGQNGMEQNDKKAFNLFNQAAEEGNAEGAFQLAEYFALDKCGDEAIGFGGGASENIDRNVRTEILVKYAAFWYKKAADQGHAEASFKFSRCIPMSQDLKKEYGDVREKYEQAAKDKGCLEAFFYGYVGGINLNSTTVKAVQNNPLFGWLKDKAEKGDSNCMFWFGLTYAFCGDFEEADNWLTKAAEKGVAAAQDYLGQKFEFGGILSLDYSKQKCEKDEKEAVKWYMKAAEQNYLPAQFHLARCYEKGKGIEESDEDAVKWYRKTAEQPWNFLTYDGFYYLDRSHAPFNTNDTKAEAAYKLGQYYEKGWGVEKNLNEAVKWYKKALSYNKYNQETKSALDRLGIKY